MSARAPSVGLALALALTVAAAWAHAAPALLDSLDAWQRAGDVARVDSVSTPAIVAARASGDDSMLQRLLLARGRTRAAFGLAGPAEPDLREALRLAGAVRDTAGSLDALRWLGVSLSQLGRAAEAAQSYRALAAMAAAAADSQHLGWAWLGLAFDRYQAGQSGSAATLYARAAGVLGRARAPRGAAWAWSGLGLALRQQGAYPEAAAAFERALSMARAEGDAFNTAAALDYLGRLQLQVGDPARAAAMLQEALDIHRRHHHRREGALAAIDVATALTLQGRLELASTGLDSVRAACERDGLLDLELLATVSLADVRLAQERPGAAAALCRSGLAHAQLPSTMVATELRLSLARALAAQDSLAAALSVLDAARAQGPGATSLALRVAADRARLLLALGRAAAAWDELRPAVVTARAVGALELEVALRTSAGRAALALGEPDSALPAFRRGADAWEAARALPADHEWRELRAAAAAELFSCGAAAMLEHPARWSPAQRAAAAFEFAQRYKARTLQERLRGPGSAATPAPAPTAPGALRRAGVLRAGDVFLDFLQCDELSVVFCLTPDTLLAGVLPGARTILPHVRRLEDLLASRGIDDVEAARQPALRIAALLPEPVRAELARAHRVFFSPDGRLSLWPLALLTGSEADALLPPTCQIARVPAIALLRPAAVARSIGRAAARVLAIAGRDSPGTGVLEGADAETRWLAASLQHVVRTGAPGQAALDSAVWRDADVVHIAAHVRVDAQQPWNTEVAVGSPWGGELRARDIERLRLPARLAVLSGCRTAGSRAVGGEGLLGVATGFVVSGTPAVVATLWPVDDLTAACFTRQFYMALAEGLTAGEALARARGRLRGSLETRSARDWAGFVLVGDPDVRVPIRARARNWPMAAVLAALAVGVAGMAAHGSARRRPIP